jgi:hypothetical protein
MRFDGSMLVSFPDKFKAMTPGKFRRPLVALNFPTGFTLHIGAGYETDHFGQYNESEIGSGPIVHPSLPK